MVIFVKPNGASVVENTVLALGSNAGKIAIVSPTRPSAFVQLLITPPTGRYMEPMYAAPMLSTDIDELGVYLCSVAQGITNVAGRVRYQVSFEYEDGTKELTPEGTFIVAPGVITIPPDQPDTNMYEEIKSALISNMVNYAEVVEKLDKVWEAAKLVEDNLSEIRLSNAQAQEASRTASGFAQDARGHAESAAQSAAAAAESEKVASEAKTLLEKIPKLKFKTVDALPSSDIDANTIYLRKGNEENGDRYSEHLFVPTVPSDDATRKYSESEGAWERIGSQQISLDGYATEQWVDDGFVEKKFAEETEERLAALEQNTSSGIHIGPDAPTGGETVWVDTDEEATVGASGEIPTFDLVALGLPEVSTGGGGPLLQTDTTAMRDALDRGVVKFLISTTMLGTTEFVVGKCSVLDSGLYLCYYPLSNGMLSMVISDGFLQVSVIPDIHLPDVKAEDNGKVLMVVDGEWSATTPAAGGVASWNDLTDKPFGDNEDGTVTQLDNKYLSILSQTGGWGALLPQNTGESYYNTEWGAYTFGFQTTQDVYDKWVANTSAIRVKYDGKTYTVTPQVLDSLTMVGNCVGFGGTGNGEPFVLGIIVQLTDGQFSYHWLVGALADTAPTEHTVSVSMFDSAIYTVNEDNLPMDAIKTVVDDYINEALGGDY